VLLGAPKSGTNSKRIVRFGPRMALIKSKAAINWQSSLVAQLQQQYTEAPMQHTVALSLTFYRAKRVGDIDNPVKPVMDALEKAGVLLNDKQVCELHVVRSLDRANPRVELTLTPRPEAA